MTNPKLAKTLRGTLSLAVALALVVWVVRSSGIEPLEVLASVDRVYLLGAFLCYGVGVGFASWRWFLLLNHIRVEMPFLTVLRLALIGLFFNLLVPGGVGGDLIKAVYLRRESGDRYPQALLTVLLDRLVGLAGLLAIAILAVVLNASMIARGPVELQGLLVLVGFTSVGGLLGGLLFFFWPWISRRGGQWTEGVRRRLPLTLQGVLRKVAEALDLLRASPLKLTALFFLSMLGHLTSTVGMYLVAKSVSFGAFQLPFAPCLLATQLANLVSAVPLTPGGLGGRDLVLKLLLLAAGAPEDLSGAIPMLVTVLLICWSLVGGLALLWERGAGVVAGAHSSDSNESR